MRGRKVTSMPVPLAFEWRNVVFCHWPIECDRLEPAIPAGLTIDTHYGTGWISIVALSARSTRPRGLPRWTGIDVNQLNLRTYVEKDGEPGVYFCSIDADSVFGVLGARLAHHLPYYYASITADASDGRISIRSRRRHRGERPATFAGTFRLLDDAYEPEPESLAAFLAERRRLYTRGTDDNLRYMDIDHHPWTLYPVDGTIDANTMFDASALPRPTTDPVIYYSPGLDAVTSRNVRWDHTSSAPPRTESPQ